VTKEHLPLEKMGPVLHIAHAHPVATTMPAPPQHGNNPRAPTLTSIDETVTGLHAQELVRAAGGAEDGQRQLIVDALEKCGGNQSHAAKLLGISRGTLIKRIHEFNLPRPRKRE
jgi:two-component system response regulator AtoC